MSETERKLEYGDVIFVKRNIGSCHYKHYGICSEIYPNKVIHFVREGTQITITFNDGVELEVDFNGVLRETSLREFLDGANEYYICEFDEWGYKIKDTKARIMEVAAAYSFRVRSNLFDYEPDESDLPRIEAYRKCNTPEETVQNARKAMENKIKWKLLVNNCEHFAMWCKTNVATSEQADGLASAFKSLFGKKEHKKFPPPRAIIPIKSYF